LLSLLFTVGRFITTPLMAKFKPGNILAIYMVISAVLFFVGFLGLGEASVFAMIIAYLFVSIGSPTIFSLTINGLQGSAVKTVSSGLIMAIVGAALIPLATSAIADAAGVNIAFLVCVPGFLFCAWYGWKGCKIGLDK
ncbi:MAG: MFS transporter, partial [Bacillota bacterium]|nr:MFS transporter [Bacillota bacterium]